MVKTQRFRFYSEKGLSCTCTAEVKITFSYTHPLNIYNFTTLSKSKKKVRTANLKKNRLPTEDTLTANFNFAAFSIDALHIFLIIYMKAVVSTLF